MDLSVTIIHQLADAGLLSLSGGCSTAGFDKLSDPKDSVVLTLLHYGAVGFLGGPRNAITGSGLVHSTFWNQIALKKTMGEAFKDGSLTLNDIDFFKSDSQDVSFSWRVWETPLASRRVHVKANTMVRQFRLIG